MSGFRPASPSIDLSIYQKPLRKWKSSASILVGFYFSMSIFFGLTNTHYTHTVSFSNMLFIAILYINCYYCRSFRPETNNPRIIDISRDSMQRILKSLSINEYVTPDECWNSTIWRRVLCGCLMWNSG